MKGDRARRKPQPDLAGIVWFALGIPLLVCGCSGTSGDEFRIVSDADVEQRQTEPASSSLTQTDPDSEDDTGPETHPIDVPLADSSAASDASSEPLVPSIKLLVPERTFSNEGSDGAVRVSFDDLDLEKVLNVTKPPPDIVEHFPGWLAGLDGQRIRIRGFMSPAFQATDLKGFLMGLNPQCFFGPNRKIYHLIEVAMRDGVTTEYLHNVAFDVEGIFRIRPDADGDELWQLYQIEDAIILED